MLKSRDLILLEKSKQGDNVASYQLYKLYGALITNRSKQAHCDHEDFRQDAYECMMKAVDYVKIDRITNPESWGFYQTFSNFLMKRVYKINKHLGIEVPTSGQEGQCFSESTPDTTLDSANAHNLQFGPIFHTSPTMSSFIVSSRLEEKYDDFLCAVPSHLFTTLSTYQEVRTIVATAKRLNREYAQVSQELKELKQLAIEFFDVRNLA